VSVGVHLGHIEPRHAPGLEPLPLETSVSSRLRTAVGSPGAVAELGRWVLVALPVFLLCAAADGSLASALAPAALFTVGWVLALRSAYRGIHVVFGSAIRAAVGTAVGLAAVSALDFWLGRPVPAPTLIACGISIFALAAIWESVCQRVLGRRRRVLIIGTGSSAWEVVDAVRRSDGMRFSVLGAVGHSRPDEPIGGAPTLGTIADLKGIVENYRPDLVVLADDEAQEQALNRLLETRNASFKVATVASFFEYAFGRVPLRCLPPSWFLSILHLRQRPYSRFAKRAFDVVVASIGLVLTAPISAVIAGLVRLSPGPIIYRQVRVGQGGEPFTMYKFRTMRADAEAEGALFTAERDPRMTRVGRFVRMTHLDELPQLWDVLKGDMSIVGPRPERPEFVPMLEGAVPYFTRRLLVKPGITGWAQLRSDYACDCDSAADKLSYDLWYLRNRNLLVDLAICAKTFTSIMLRPGR
jgi:exopolysaccharide biosynthesis polyprenyl glycosylphosphotransferase